MHAVWGVKLVRKNSVDYHFGCCTDDISITHIIYTCIHTYIDIIQIYIYGYESKASTLVLRHYNELSEMSLHKFAPQDLIMQMGRHEPPPNTHTHTHTHTHIQSPISTKHTPPLGVDACMCIAEGQVKINR